jgi:hypothetical protein
MAESFHTAFADALVDRARPLPEGVAAWTGAVPVRRFQVYRNNVFWGLVEALKSRFPASVAIVGEDFFHAMAEAYIRHDPPRSPLLLGYGDGLADFAAGFPPAESLPYLPDVLRLEAARSHAYHAADRAPLDAGSLATIAPSALETLVLTPHPSLSVLQSTHPVVTIWAMNAGEMPLGPIERWEAEDALIVRPAMTVHVHRLPPGGAGFAQALAAGAPLGQAAASAGADPRFDLTATLALILHCGAFAAFS